MCCDDLSSLSDLASHTPARTSCANIELGGVDQTGSPDFDKIARVYFVQYHLHLQLLEASNYSASLGVALKGDLPIGVTRCSQVGIHGLSAACFMRMLMP